MQMVIFGLGYTGAAIAAGAVARGWQVTATSRDPARLVPPAGVKLIGWGEAGPALATATHVVQTAPPGDADPALTQFGPAVAAAPLVWLGYLSTTGVYGDRGGGWVDEDTPPAPTSERAERRVSAENAWRLAAGARALDIFRVAGIYGPGRSALDEMRSGRARRVVKAGHLFGRIHRDDIAAAVLAGAARPDGVRVLNLTDDEPAASADVVAEAARLLGVAPPPAIAFDDAVAGMSEMGRSFWAESRRVHSRAQEVLGLRWRYPTYREGLAGILLEERGEGAPQ